MGDILVFEFISWVGGRFFFQIFLSYTLCYKIFFEYGRKFCIPLKSVSLYMMFLVSILIVVFELGLKSELVWYGQRIAEFYLDLVFFLLIWIYLVIVVDILVLWLLLFFWWF